MSTAYALGPDRVLDVKIDGRVTPEAIEMFRAGLIEALDAEALFAVCFDRSSMTATTKEGRAALERWASEFLPRLAGRCVGWADVYDARRAASLANAASAREGQESERVDEEHGPPAYPQQTFADLDQARAWLRGLLAERRAGTPA